MKTILILMAALFFVAGCKEKSRDPFNEKFVLNSPSPTPAPK
jgi:uncharacterized lipoprotein YajG